MSNDGKAPNVIDRLVVAPDEDLSDDELRERWKFQQPLTNLYAFTLIGMIVGIAWMFVGDDFQYGLMVIGGSIAVMVSVSAYLSRRASTKTREQMLRDIKWLREMHADLDM